MTFRERGLGITSLLALSACFCSCRAVWGFEPLTNDSDDGGITEPEDGSAHDADALMREADATPVDSESGCRASANPGENLALARPATADQIRSANEDASKANDGSLATRWSAADGVPGHSWTVDLGSSFRLGRIATTWEQAGIAYQYRVEVSTNGTDFTLVIDRTNSTETTRSRSDTFPESTCARFVRVTKTDVSGWWAILYEVEVYGLSSSS